MRRKRTSHRGLKAVLGILLSAGLIIGLIWVIEARKNQSEQQAYFASDVSQASSAAASASASPAKPYSAPTAAGAPSPAQNSGKMSPSPAYTSSEPKASATPASTPKGSAAPSMKPSTPSPSPTETKSSQPPLLTSALGSAGLSFSDLDFSQLILVSASGSSATVYCYAKGSGGVWSLNEALSFVSGYVGRNGTSSSKHEGDGCTPLGLYALGFAFGNNPKPDTAMHFRSVTPDSYWVDDPNSAYYNEWVEGKDDADWNSAEHLADNPSSYAYAVTVNYNMDPIVPGRGSAIFLHCGGRSTSGCIALPESSVLAILGWLNPSTAPHILIVTG